MMCNSLFHFGLVGANACVRPAQPTCVKKHLTDIGGSAIIFTLIRGISSAWLERLLDMQKVTGSSPVSPTIFKNAFRLDFMRVKRISCRRNRSLRRHGKMGRHSPVSFLFDSLFRKTQTHSAMYAATTEANPWSRLQVGALCSHRVPVISGIFEKKSRHSANTWSRNPLSLRISRRR